MDQSQLENKQQPNNFWQELDLKVQQIQTKNKKKLHSRNLSSVDEGYRRTIQSRPQIQESYHHELEQEVKLNNRIKFLDLEKEKQKRTLELAKFKYERVMEIRNKSFQEKKECKERILQTRQKIARDVQTRASRIRSERKRINISVQKIREKNENDANDVRSLSFQNEEAIRSSKIKQTEQNRQLVEKKHQQIEKSRISQQLRKKQTEDKGRMEHSCYLQQKLRINYAQQRKNSILKQKLHDSLVACSKDREETMTELKHYTIQLKQKNNINLKRFNSTHTTAC